MTKFNSAQINIHDAKTHLSRFVKKTEEGQSFVLCRHGKPVAELIPFSSLAKKLRPIGLAKGKGKIKKSFFTPLSEDEFPLDNL